MFKNNLKIAWRNLKTNRLFSTINIVGLSIGLAIVMLLFLYISNERSFDLMYSKKDRIHRVLVETEGDFGFDIWAGSKHAHFLLPARQPPHMGVR
mgnify:CR=1 FL=1